MLTNAPTWLIALALAAESQPVPVGMPLDNDADPYRAVVARMVRAIVQYSRWPGNPRHLRACVVGPTDHADDLLKGREVAEIGVEVVGRSPDRATPAECQIVYIGRLGINEQRKVTARMQDGAALTIAENDPACRSRAMICLLFEAQTLSFRLNIDAVSRSQVRIDPRVLRLSGGDSR
ncbi:MAG: hypothetical protein KatS3mg120_0286 [Erythrobacter sp.]|jgi:hypothetical protein|nr:MAG: hypothetical protein KatS3mg120_0286 [Erythrobacter sp.]